jgi:phosphoesterase RecJ-like protein
VTGVNDSAAISPHQAREFRSFVNAGKTVLVTTHVAPDGDAAASLLAAARIVELSGGHPVCLLDGEIPPHLSFLPGTETIAGVGESDLCGTYDTVLVVDSANLERIGEVQTRFNAGARIINIDHHADNTRFGHLNIVTSAASSTAEILFDLCIALRLRIGARLATLLYTGILTDTGGFRHTNTTAHTFSTAGRPAAYGADPNAVAEAVYAGNSPVGLKLLGQALTSLELSPDGRIAAMMIAPPDGWEEMEDLAEYPLRVRGVQAAALLRVLSGAVRVSLRGKGSVNVSKVAHRFGGGGHPKAAGFTARGDPETIRCQVFELLQGEIERHAPTADH